MKVREGFVSNSSSSSYVITMSKKRYAKLLEEADEIDCWLLERYSKESKLDELELMSIAWQDGNSEDLDEEEWEIPGRKGLIHVDEIHDNRSALYEKFKKMQKKHQCIITEEYF